MVEILYQSTLVGLAIGALWWVINDIDDAIRNYNTNKYYHRKKK